MRLLLCSIFGLLLGLVLACTPQSGDSIGNSAKSKAKSTATNTKKLAESILVAEVKGRGTKITASKAVLTSIFSDRFKDTKFIPEFQILSYNERFHYITARGMYKKSGVIAAIELELKEDGFYAEKFNKSQHKCTTKYCATCSFEPKADGQIKGCSCTAGEDNPTEDMASCEYSISIQTMEKQ